MKGLAPITLWTKNNSESNSSVRRNFSKKIRVGLVSAQNPFSILTEHHKFGVNCFCFSAQSFSQYIPGGWRLYWTVSRQCQLIYTWSNWAKSTLHPISDRRVVFWFLTLFSRTSLLRTILLVRLQAYKGHMTQKSRARLVGFLYTGASHVCFQQKSASEWGVSIHVAGAGAVKVHEIGRKCRDASFLLRISWVYRVFLPLCTLESPEICWL